MPRAAPHRSVRTHAAGRPALALAAFALATFVRPADAGSGWIPPSSITVALPGATVAPGGSRTLALTVRANGSPATVAWTATAAGQFTPSVIPASGSISVGANQIASVPLTIGVPGGAIGAASITIELTQEVGGGVLGEASATVFAATAGRPEIWPDPSTAGAGAGAPAAVGFQIHSLIGSSEDVVLTTGRSNPDPNNAGAQFPGSPAAVDVTLPAGGTVTVSVPTTISGSAYAGNVNAIQLSVTSNGGISTAMGHALASAALPESLPTALIPVGLTPMGSSAWGRDGAARLPGRPYRLAPSGTDGVRVLGSQLLTSIGPLDFDANGLDDRLLGQIRIPALAVALDVVPAFVTASDDTLDLGLLAAGRSGLMILDLRQVEDPQFGTWSETYDVDENGIDDRILRTIPTGGFATDVEWFRAPSGRVVALVADADTGSVPVAASYDPALTVSGTGSGVVVIDVAAALDSLGSVPYAAGTLATPGSALDLELRGGSSPDLAIADGDAGAALYHLTAGPGAPAAVSFVLRGAVSLSSAWGAPYARDVEWVADSPDSPYFAAAASAGGVQLLRAPTGDAPSLVLAQQTAAPAIGLAAAPTGALAVAMGSGGVALLRAPGRAELDRIAAGAAPPYTAPVALARGASWTEGWPLETAHHFTPSGSATALRFEPVAAPTPDLFVSDGGRVLVLRPGSAPITAVEAASTPPRASVLHVRAVPNPLAGPGEFWVWSAPRREGAGPAGGPERAGEPARARLELYDARGSLVRRMTRPAWETNDATGHRARFSWDGRDEKGRALPSGLYWVRAHDGGEAAVRSFVILR